MSDQGYLEVKNWKAFQHYKDRDPLWIKLYRGLLADYAFSRLQDASKLHLIFIWLLASESGGRIPNDQEWVEKRIPAKGPVDLSALIDAGFLTIERRKQSASKPIAKRLPRDRDRDRGIAEPRKDTWLTPFSDAWKARCGGAPPFGRLAAALKPLVDEQGAPEVLGRWTRYLDATEPKFCSAERFAQTFGAWVEPDTKEFTDDFGVMRKWRRVSPGQWEIAS